MGTDRSGPRQQVYFQGSTPEASALFSIPAARKSERERERGREKTFRDRRKAES